MQGQLQGVPGVSRGAWGAPGVGAELSLRTLGSVQPPFAVMLSFRERGEQPHFMHIYLARHWCALGAVVKGFFLSEWQEQGCERAFKPPLWSCVLSLIGVCLSPSLKAALTSPEANFQASSEAQGSRERACKALSWLCNSSRGSLSKHGDQSHTEDGCRAVFCTTLLSNGN